MNKEQLIEKLEEGISQFDSSCQECLEEVESICYGFDGMEQDKKEIVKHFEIEWSDEEWVSKMIEDVLFSSNHQPIPQWYEQLVHLDNHEACDV